MNISLTRELEQLVHTKVQSGLYLSASEVIREALRLLEEFERLKGNRLAQLRSEVALGLEQLDRGEVVNGEAFFRELQQRDKKTDAPTAEA